MEFMPFENSWLVVDLWLEFLDKVDSFVQSANFLGTDRPNPVLDFWLLFLDTLADGVAEFGKETSGVKEVLLGWFLSIPLGGACSSLALVSLVTS